MAWTSPVTVVARGLVTAALWNAVRDDLNLTAVGIAATGGRIMCSAGSQVLAERIPDGASIATSQTTASLTYVDLATAGPSVNRGNGVKILAAIGCHLANGTAGQGARMAYALSGSNTIAAADTNSICIESANASDTYSVSWVTVHDPLTAGTLTLTAKYRAVGAGTATFSSRIIAMIPF